MASLLLSKADKMKQRLQKSLAVSCSSAASTSVVVAFSSGRAVACHEGEENRTSSSTKLRKKKTRTSSNPASSSRFLLNSSRLQPEQSGDVTILDSLPPSSFIDVHQPKIAEPPLTLLDADDKQQQQQEAVITRRSTSCTQHQVVVLKVSLHCKGCAGKVRKHISKMEGVTSFDIDIATKKVTVMGDVTPLGVLNCISKVKSAQFWPSSSSPPRASASF